MSCQKKVGVKFLLKYGHYLAVPVSQEEVSGIFGEFLDESPLRRRYLSGDSDGVQWTIDLREVVTIHTFPMEPVPMQTVINHNDLRAGMSGFVYRGTTHDIPRYTP